jgi:hypothetical protein
VTSRTEFRGRRAATIENDALRVTVLEEGGHLAEVFHKKSGVSPLWIPRWPSMEPSAFDPARDRRFGTGPDAKLLAGIMGHNLCLDIFGGPSDEEAAAGLTAHGEASIALYTITESAASLTMSAQLPAAALRVHRHLSLHGEWVRVRESVENLGGCDRPVGWTQHVTLGAPFLQPGRTQFQASATRSQVFESTFGVADYLRPAGIFDWPFAPRIDGELADLRVFPNADSSSAYTAHLMDRGQEDAYFIASTPEIELAFGYVWKHRDFPWLGIWEENRSRAHSPWNLREVTRGMEFGVSPFPESRRKMIDRGSLFGVPTYRWIPARGKAEVQYWIVARSTQAAPESLAWPEAADD